MSLDLIYPAKGTKVNYENLPVFPNKHGQASGYYLLAVVSDKHHYTSEKYVCFTDHTMGSVWIEKVSSLAASKWLAMDETVRIEDDDEFSRVFNYLQEQGILE